MVNPGGSVIDYPSAGAKGKEKWLFWGCYIALIATSVAFVTRLALLNQWGKQFNLSGEQLGQIGGAGIWPFAISIILFSFVVDKIGYKTAMIFAFVAHIAYGIMVICAPMVLVSGPGATPEQIESSRKTAYWLLYAGSVILGLSNGTVEAVINPVVATMFNKEKVKWLNILHSGWPAGLVGGGLLAIALGNQDWRWTIAVIFIPAVIYGFMMISAKFPINERVAAGGSYMGMIKEFGILAAIIVVALVVRQIGVVFEFSNTTQLIIGAIIVVAFGAVARSPGRIMLFVMMLIMMPLATTEIGTDGWITALMEKPLKELGMHGAWVLVYTSVIMMLLRAFAAGPIAHKLNPLGLLALSAAIAAVGLFWLSKSTGLAIFGAATLYALGKTFFWPTMLGVVAEQCPKGGALTLNAVGGMGMLAVGVLGFPFIGQLQDHVTTKELRDRQPTLAAIVTVDKDGMYGKYSALDSDKVKALSAPERAAAKAIALTAGKTEEEAEAAAETAAAAEPRTKEILTVQDHAQHSALATMAIFPCVMLVCYLGMMMYFKSKGGYKPVEMEYEAPKNRGFEVGAPKT